MTARQRRLLSSLPEDWKEIEGLHWNTARELAAKGLVMLDRTPTTAVRLIDSFRVRKCKSLS